MHRVRLLKLAIVAWLGCCTSLPAQESTGKRTSNRLDTFPTPTKLGKLTPPVELESLPPVTRDQIGKVMHAPTLTATATADEFTSPCETYLWLLDHPDRVSLAWQRINVAAIDIVAHADGRFTWKDEQGSELCWKTVCQNGDGRIWYAEGKVRPGTLCPTVPVKAVAVLRHGTKKNALGEMAICHQVEVFLQTDSRAAAAVMKLIGPAAPRMAQDGAEQLLLFFSGIARYVERHPTKAGALLAEKK